MQAKGVDCQLQCNFPYRMLWTCQHMGFRSMVGNMKWCFYDGFACRAYFQGHRAGSCVVAPDWTGGWTAQVSHIYLLCRHGNFIDDIFEVDIYEIYDTRQSVRILWQLLSIKRSGQNISYAWDWRSEKRWNTAVYTYCLGVGRIIVALIHIFRQ